MLARPRAARGSLGGAMADGSIPRRDFLVSAGAGVAATMVTGSTAQSQGATPATAATRPADLILKNANVITIDARSSVAEAIAIAGDKILAVGPDAAMAAHTAPTTRVLDLNKRTVMPGLNDGHAHMDREALRNVFPALGKVRSIKDYAAIRFEGARAPGRCPRHQGRTCIEHRLGDA